MNPTFARRLIRWQHRCGRHNLPWQGRDAYGVWLSEIMLQQTQVATVLDYYPRFLAAFPDVAALAKADQDRVLSLWAGLGYYSRARNLHKAAQQVVNDFGGSFPSERTELEKLCGVGRSTAAAIAAFAFGKRETILDGNVKRVLCRVFGLDGDPADKAFERSLWDLAQTLLPENAADMQSYTQGLMDLGATVCKRSKPDCGDCPMSGVCVAEREGRTAELPRKKAAVKVKTLTLYWLILKRRDGALLLQKRPQRGIWAGLYCVPCFESRSAWTQYAAALGLDEQDFSEGAAFEHKLTHRRLEIIPLYAQWQGQAAGLPESEPFSGSLWVAPAELPDYGMPKPLNACLAAQQGRLDFA